MKTPRLLSNPLVLFAFFAVANFPLAYGSGFPFEVKLLLFFAGLAFPFSMGLKARTFEPFSPKTELFQNPPAGIWISLVALAVLLRALQVFVFAQWPVGDDALFAYYSMELSEHWQWRFFFDQTQHPPLFNWTLALFFKLIPPSLLSIKIFPALLSLGAFAVSYFAARTYLSRSFSLVFCALCGLSFWPLYAGRFCMYMPFLFLWELASFGALGWYLTAKPSEKTKPALYLGLLTALGSWLAIAWPLVILMIGFAVVYQINERKLHVREISLLALPSALSTIFYSIVSFMGENGRHLNELWAFNPPFHWEKFSTDALSNITALFWGCDLQNSYGPVWGGMLNPLLASLFFLGLLGLIRGHRSAQAQWLLAGLFLFLVPGFLSKYFDIFRLSPLLPLLLFIVAIGAFQLISLAANPWRGRLLGLLLLVSTGLDGFHLWKTYNAPLSVAGSNISLQQEEFTKAFDLLNKTNRLNGPGLIWLELQPGFEDQTLKIATYPFNAAYNPTLDPQKVSWGAILCNVNYKPFLAKRFPAGKWIWLGKDTAWTYGGLMLGLIPLYEIDPADLAKWTGFNEALKGITSLELNAHKDDTAKEVADQLHRIEPLAANDPFLESCYAERVLFHGKLAGIFNDPLPIIQKAIRRGYPTSVFFLAEGILWSGRGEDARAKLSFKKALHAPLDLTPAEENLKALEELEKRKRSVKKGD